MAREGPTTPEAIGDGSGNRVARTFLRAIAAMNALGGVWIAALMLLINADVFAREALTAPIRGISELVAMSIVGIVFLQIAHTLWSGRITRSDSLLDRLTRARPAAGHGLDALFHLAGAAVMAVLCWASLPYFSRALEEGEYVGALGDFTAPTWPIRLIILIGSGATSVTFLALAVRGARRAMRRSLP